jgi:glucan-binding YG repeat protein
MIKMAFLIFFIGVFLVSKADATNFELKTICKNASNKMPKGKGEPVKYPNGRELTSKSGQVGVTWYYMDGRILTDKMGVPGSVFYYKNGRRLSDSFGSEGATWYFMDGRIMTTSGRKLTPLEMAEAACDLILDEPLQN